MSLSWAELADTIAAYVEAGLSKFVVRPAESRQADRDAALREFMDEFAEHMLPLQN